ncbi:MAG TPA: GntR family transcriptional regulator [Candidatus Sulfotelmatobacter sp.]|nr:GntR family transcriptional regulator [Candidatus Sulfotelmatobacter sp.]
MDTFKEGALKTLAIHDKIKSMIANGELEMGEKITENQLSQLFGVSKAPIRSAMRWLAADGLIQIQPRAGSFIFTLDESEIEQINSVRCLLESAALRSAMKVGPSRLLPALNENLQKADQLQHEDSNYRKAYRKLDSEFHQLLLRFSDNPYLCKAYSTIATKVWAMRSGLTFPDSHLQISLGFHKRIVDLLGEGDVDQACVKLEEHISGSFTPREKTLLSRSQD